MYCWYHQFISDITNYLLISQINYSPIKCRIKSKTTCHTMYIKVHVLWCYMSQVHLRNNLWRKILASWIGKRNGPERWRGGRGGRLVRSVWWFKSSSGARRRFSVGHVVFCFFFPSRGWKNMHVQKNLCKRYQHLLQWRDVYTIFGLRFSRYVCLYMRSVLNNYFHNHGTSAKQFNISLFAFPGNYLLWIQRNLFLFDFVIGVKFLCSFG